MENYRTLLDVAKNETGLNDFGSDAFLEGLEILVKSLQDEANLNALGEQVLRGRILGHLKQRLQIEDWYRRFPDIDDGVIESPLIGLSLPRTGSTVLSFLLAQDPNARSLYREEAAEPCPPPGSGQRQQQERGKQEAEAKRIGMRSHVPTGAISTAECQDLMALDFKSHMFQAFAQIPSYSQWLLDADLTTTYVYERRALKLLQWRLPEKPWRLKCPTHLLFLAHLNNAFPDAKFVMTHREPSDVMLSVVDVYADIVSKFTDTMDIAYLVDLNVQHWSTGMQRALAFRDAGNDARFYDIDFRAMHRDPIGAVKGLYAWLGEPVSDEFAAGMANWWQENSANREPSSPRKPEEFGLDLDRVRPLFADYSARFVAPQNT